MANPTVQLNVPIVAIDKFSDTLKQAQAGLQGFYRLGQGDLTNLTEQMATMAKAVASLASAFTGTGGLIAGVTAFGAAAAIGAAAMAGVTVAVSRWAQGAAGVERFHRSTDIAYGRLRAFQQAASASDFKPGLQAIENAVTHLQKLKLRDSEERKQINALIPEHLAALEKLAEVGKFEEAIDYIVKLSSTLDVQTVGLLTQHFFNTPDTEQMKNVWELSKQYEKQFELTKEQKATIMEIEQTLAQIVIEWNVLLTNLANWVAPEVLNLLKHVRDLIQLANKPPEDPVKKEANIQDQIRYWAGLGGTGIYAVPWLGAAGYDAMAGTNTRGAVREGFKDFIQWMINNVWRGGFISSAKAGEMPGGAFGADGADVAGAGTSYYGGGGPTFRSGIGPGSSGHVSGNETIAGAPEGLAYDASDTGFVGIGDYNFMGSRLAASLGMGDVQPGSPQLMRFKTGITDGRGPAVITANKYAGRDIAGFLKDLHDAGAPLVNFNGVYANKRLQHGMGNAVDIETGFGSGPNNSRALWEWAQAHPKEFAYIQAKHHMRNLDTSSGARMHDWGHFEWTPTGRAPAAQPAAKPPEPVKSSSLVGAKNAIKLAVNLNVRGPAGTSATAVMSSDQYNELFDTDTIRKAILA